MCKSWHEVAAHHLSLFVVIFVMPEILWGGWPGLQCFSVLRWSSGKASQCMEVNWIGCFC